MSRIARIASRPADLGGGVHIFRALPTKECRMVGPWCFLDHAGPIDFAAGHGMHVGAHPHIGLQTFTWMIEGEVLHRDSLGNEQIIRPGQVNLMTAGRGIVHTEDSLVDGQRLHAAQLWIALPEGDGDCEPAFEHIPTLPAWEEAGARLTLLAGRHGTHQAPGRYHSPLMGMDVHSPAGSSLTLALDPAFEYGLLPLEGGATLGGETFQPDEFAYLGRGNTEVSLDLPPGGRVILLGGEPFAQPVLMWWNFVGFDKAVIAQAQRHWETGDPRFGPVVDASERRLVPPPLPWADPGLHL